MRKSSIFNFLEIVYFFTIQLILLHLLAIILYFHDLFGYNLKKKYLQSCDIFLL